MSRVHPGLPGAVVRTATEVVADSGELRQSLNWTVSPETIQEFREGYRCALPPHGCGAAQETAFPAKCIEPYCNFNLRDNLGRWFAQVFEGEEDLWPDREQDDPLEQHRFYASKAGIVLPPGFRP